MSDGAIVVDACGQLTLGDGLVAFGAFCLLTL
jgi:hypothetical protein